MYIPYEAHNVINSNTHKLTNNTRNTNYFTKKFTNCWCSEWLLVNEKVILIMGLDEN